MVRGMIWGRVRGRVTVRGMIWGRVRGRARLA